MAEFEERRRFHVEGRVVERAHDVVAVLALADGIDQPIACSCADGVQEFREEPGPKQEEVADVLVHLALPLEGIGIEPDVAFDEHLRQRADSPAFRVADREDRLVVQKLGKHLGKVDLDVFDVAHSEPVAQGIVYGVLEKRSYRVLVANFSFHWPPPSQKDGSTVLLAYDDCADAGVYARNSYFLHENRRSAWGGGAEGRLGAWAFRPATLLPANENAGSLGGVQWV